MTSASMALLAAIAAAGVLMIVARLRDRQRPTIAGRVRPYLARRASAGSGARPPTGVAALDQLLQPLLRDLGRSMDRRLGGRRALLARLERAGLPPDVESFRVRQAGALALGVVGGIGVVVLMAAAGDRPSVVPAALVVALAGVAGPLAVDQHLSSRSARRREAMLAELPTIAELLALSVAAGESVGAALERAGRSGQGVLADEIARTVGEARTGTPLVDALSALSRRCGQPAVARFVDGVVIAIERGTPLADVLRAQAADVREAGRRDLMESAGRREIAMMTPVVFLVMPVTVLFALFPGFFGLSLTV
jgi:tight adherence protein C